MTRSRIIILGGGFAGLSIAIKLAQRKVSAEIILIDKDDEHLYTPWLYKIPSDIYNNGLHTLRNCNFLFKELLKDKKIEFRKLEIKALLPDKNRILFTNGNTLDYDYAVIALGAQANFFGLKEIERKAHLLNSPQSVENVYLAFESIMNEAVNQQLDKHVVIVGGGATGIEIATELAFIRKSKNIKHLSISLINSSDKLLSRFAPICGKSATKRCKDLGINVFSRSVATDLRGDDLIIRNSQGEKEIHADLLLWAAGISMNTLIKNLDIEKDDYGRVIVNGHLQSSKYNNLFFGGDCASFADQYNNSIVPPTAWAAIEQANIIAYNLHAQLNDKAMKDYEPPKRYPGVVALGGHYAAGSINNIPVKGYIAYLLKELIHLHYFFGIMSFSKAIKTFRRKKLICK